MKRRHKASASTMEERERKREVIRFLIDFRAAQEEYMKMNPIRYKKLKQQGRNQTCKCCHKISKTKKIFFKNSSIVYQRKVE